MEASPTDTAALRSATVSSLGWAWLGVVVQAALQLAYTAVISRLVAPGEFGVIAAAMLVLKFVT